MNSNRSNTRMIVIANSFVLNEEWNSQIDKASSPHLEMLKKIIEKLQSNYGKMENVLTNDVMSTSINLARTLQGIVVQIFPSGSSRAEDIMMMVYYDNNPLSNDVINNFKEVYSNLVTGRENSVIKEKYTPLIVQGALTLSEPDFSDSNTLSREDSSDTLTIDDIISILPVEVKKERSA